MRRLLALSGFALFALLASSYSPRVSAAATWQIALSECNAEVSSRAATLPGNPYCQLRPAPNKEFWIVYQNGASRTYCISGCFFSGDFPPSNPCSVIVPARIYNQGKILEGSSLCKRTSDPVTGGYVQCALTFAPNAPPTQNQYSGAWETYGTLAPSGNVCAGSEGDPWKDGNGGALSPAPPIPTLPAVDVPAPPQVCGGGSCYDPKNDKYCATSGGAQFCVSGATARSSAGGCVTSGDATICAGSPSAPKPPAPPASPITDPATQIKSQDNTTQADKVTGTPQNVSTTVYAQPSAPVESGQKPGDKGPVPKDPTEPDKGSASGGQDCNTPPICSGDAPTCMVVSQVWLDRCAVKDDKSDKNGNGQPDWTEVQPGDGDEYATGETSAGEVMSSEVADGSKIDQTSWAGNSCPTLPVVMVFGKPWSMDQGFFCEWLAMLRPIFLLIAGFIAIKITASGGKS